MNQTYCMKCMEPNSGTAVCPHCGYVAGEALPAPHVLRPGTILKEQYLLGEPLGQGGFGITYIARDLNLDIRVAIKEYYPNGFANRSVESSDLVTITDERLIIDVQKGKDSFLKEARTLARFRGTPGIVDVLHFFEANNTAYIVMEYLDGETLGHRLKRELFTADEIFRLMDPVFNTLEKIHMQDVVHRDISPDNIMIMPDGSLKLMDFGAARLMNYVDQRSVSVVLKAGYAPLEQYSTKGEQGPWTDVYALCATIYKCITGKTPADPHDRLMGEAVPWPSELGLPISVRQETVLKKGMETRQRDRFQSVGELKAALRKETIGSMESGSITLENRSSGEQTVALPRKSNKTTTKEKPEKEPDEYPRTGDQNKKIEQSVKKKKPVLLLIICAFLSVTVIALVFLLLLDKKDMPKAKKETFVPEVTATVYQTSAPSPAEAAPDASPISTSTSIDALSSGTAASAPTIKLSPMMVKQTFATGLEHTVALRENGTVFAIGYNDYGECKVSDWKDITAVDAGFFYTTGLKSNGTMVATGNNQYGQCDVSTWSDIVAFSASYEHTVGLKADGTVVAVGKNDCGQCNVSKWKDIIAIATGSSHTVGLKADGTVVATEFIETEDIMNMYQCDVSGWSDIVAIAAGSFHTVGLRSDGTVVIACRSGFMDTSAWQDIVAIAAGEYYTVGLKADGTMTATGENQYGRCDIYDWTDIVAIEANLMRTIGLKSDGTLMATGWNDHGECNVSYWNDIRMPDVTLVTTSQQAKVPTPPPISTPTSKPAPITPQPATSTPSPTPTLTPTTQMSDWTEWSTYMPPAEAAEWQAKTQYRYRENTVDSYTWSHFNEDTTGSWLEGTCRDKQTEGNYDAYYITYNNKITYSDWFRMSVESFENTDRFNLDYYAVTDENGAITSYMARLRYYDGSATFVRYGSWSDWIDDNENMPANNPPSVDVERRTVTRYRYYL